MLQLARRHPFGVEAYFERSLVLTYAVPRPILAPMVGPGLELDVYRDWGFLAIALVQTRNLRPRGFPSWLGRDFFLSGYRVFTRFIRPDRPTLRGLWILRSDTDSSAMVRLGNLFTQYRYRRAKVQLTDAAQSLEIRIDTPERDADLHVVADLASSPVPLPSGSPFRTMEDARSFAGPLPYTFSYDAPMRKMVVVKGLRQAWAPRPVRVDVQAATFLQRAPFAKADVHLANAFYLEGVPYTWKPGTLEAIA